MPVKDICLERSLVYTFIKTCVTAAHFRYQDTNPTVHIGELRLSIGIEFVISWLKSHSQVILSKAV